MLYVYLQRQTLKDRTSNVTDWASTMEFFNKTIVDDFFRTDYFEQQNYSNAGKMVWIRMLT